MDNVANANRKLLFKRVYSIMGSKTPFPMRDYQTWYQPSFSDYLSVYKFLSSQGYTMDNFTIYFFNHCKPTDSELGTLLKCQMIATEEGTSFFSLDNSKFVPKLLKKCEPRILMDKHESITYQILPEYTTVYKGNAKYGCSDEYLKSNIWNLEKEPEIKRLKEALEKGLLVDPKITTAEIPQESVYAYFHFTERLILLDPKGLIFTNNSSIKQESVVSLMLQ